MKSMSTLLRTNVQLSAAGLDHSTYYMMSQGLKRSDENRLKYRCF